MSAFFFYGGSEGWSEGRHQRLPAPVCTSVAAGDFNGDGIYDWSSNTASSATYIYDSEGIFTAILRVTDNDGYTATDTLTVTVDRAPVIEEESDSNLMLYLIVTGLVVAVGLAVVFTISRRKE